MWVEMMMVSALRSIEGHCGRISGCLQLAVWTEWFSTQHGMYYDLISCRASSIHFPVMIIASVPLRPSWLVTDGVLWMVF